MSRIFLFLCDRKKWCRIKPSCGDICKYTTNLQHAKNEFPKDINEMEARFFKKGMYNASELWWEKEKENNDEN